MDQFNEPIDLALQGDKEALLRWCFPRCHQAFNLIYEYEQKNGSFWSFDDRYYQHGIQILYERFCYAMGIIVDQFHIECIALQNANDARFKSLSDVQAETTTFVVFLSGSVDEVFKDYTRDMGCHDATYKYYHPDYLDDELIDEYENFWKRHKAVLLDIIAVRENFSSEERTYLYGFSDLDYDNTWNLDCLHMMRCSKKSGDNVDVDKFLGATKRYYLPTIIKAFMATPKEDVFSPKPQAKRWQFWKRWKCLRFQFA